MRKTKKKNLISLCALFAVATLPVGFAAMNTQVANADTTTPAVSEFYMIEGASIRTTDDELGIRFGATITQSYWESLQTAYGADATYSFYSVVTDGVHPITKYYEGVTPSFTSEDTYTFYSTIVYTTEELESAGLLEAACNLTLTAQTYVDITKDGETKATTLAAYGETGERSMKAVANALVLAGNTDEELLKYFTVGNRSEEEKGYVDISSEKAAVTMPKRTYTEGTTETVYIGAQGYEATANANGELVLANFDISNHTKADESAYVGGDELYASVFDGTAVYSTKLVVADYALTNNTFPYLKTLKDGEGNDISNKYIVLAEDIDMSTAGTWTSEGTFAGTFNGNFKEISNLTTDNGLFNTLNGATIKNFAIVDTKLTGSSHAATIAYYSNSGIRNVIENILIGVEFAGGGWKAGIVARSRGVEVISNVVVAASKSGDDLKNQGFIAGYQCADATLTNCYFISNENMGYVASGAAQKVYTTENCAIYTSDETNEGELAFLVAVTAGNSTVVLTDFARANLDKICKAVLISQADVGKLLTLTGNETVVLTEDIDIGKYLTDNNLTAWTSSVVFSGVLNGNGKKIKNMTTTRGLFNSLSGATIKNVAIVNATINTDEGHSGVFGYATVAGTTNVLENIFITATYAKGAWVGGIVSRNLGVLNITNAVISITQTATSNKNNMGLITGYQNNVTITLKNVYCISNQLTGYNAVSTANAGTYNTTNSAIYNADGETTAEVNFLTAVSAEGSTISLTDFVKSFCTVEYLN